MFTTRQERGGERPVPLPREGFGPRAAPAPPGRMVPVCCCPKLWERWWPSCAPCRDRGCRSRGWGFQGGCCSSVWGGSGWPASAGLCRETWCHRGTCWWRKPRHVSGDAMLLTALIRSVSVLEKPTSPPHIPPMGSWLSEPEHLGFESFTAWFRPIYTTQFRSGALNPSPGASEEPWWEFWCGADDGEMKRTETQGAGISPGGRSSHAA